MTDLYEKFIDVSRELVYKVPAISGFFKSPSHFLNDLKALPQSVYVDVLQTIKKMLAISENPLFNRKNYEKYVQNLSLTLGEWKTLKRAYQCFYNNINQLKLLVQPRIREVQQQEQPLPVTTGTGLRGRCAICKRFKSNDKPCKRCKR